MAKRTEHACYLVGLEFAIRVAGLKTKREKENSNLVLAQLITHCFQEFESSHELRVPMGASCWNLSRTANLLLAGWSWMAMVTAR